MGKSSTTPGFRFHPTDEELVMYYLKFKLLGIKLDPEVIAEININDFNPWDLPAKSILCGDLEWYFFSPKSKKYLIGKRRDRATKTGYWKGTGIDKEVKYKGRTVAMRKTLVFHVGPSRKRTRTNWVMHEYQMKDADLANQGVAQDAYVVCRVFEKSGLGPKNGAHYGAPFEEKDMDDNDDDDDEDEDEGSTVTSSMMVGVLVNPNNAKCSPVVNMTSSEACPSIVTPSGPSTITSWENEHTNVPVIDDDMLTHGDLASLLCNNHDNNIQEVEDPKGKKLMTEFDSSNEDSLDAFVADDELEEWLKLLGD